MAVNELDAEDLGLREGSLDVNGEGGGLVLALVGGDFLNVFDL